MYMCMYMHMCMYMCMYPPCAGTYRDWQTHPTYPDRSPSQIKPTSAAPASRALRGAARLGELLLLVPDLLQDRSQTDCLYVVHYHFPFTRYTLHSVSVESIEYF
jgi:hypothetical protein